MASQLTLAEPQRARLELLERELEALTRGVRRALKAPRISRDSLAALACRAERTLREGA
ncbi:MAG: hypothetical protein ACOZHQ_09265 [Thermodesulfobacteriota bacterium]